MNITIENYTFYDNGDLYIRKNDIETQEGLLGYIEFLSILVQRSKEYWKVLKEISHHGDLSELIQASHHIIEDDESRYLLISLSFRGEFSSYLRPASALYLVQLPKKDVVKWEDIKGIVCGSQISREYGSDYYTSLIEILEERAFLTIGKHRINFRFSQDFNIYSVLHYLLTYGTLPKHLLDLKENWNVDGKSVGSINSYIEKHYLSKIAKKVFLPELGSSLDQISSPFTYTAFGIVSLSDSIYYSFVKGIETTKSLDYINTYLTGTVEINNGIKNVNMSVIKHSLRNGVFERSVLYGEGDIGEVVHLDCLAEPEYDMSFYLSKNLPTSAPSTYSFLQSIAAIYRKSFVDFLDDLFDSYVKGEDYSILTGKYKDYLNRFELSSFSPTLIGDSILFRIEKNTSALLIKGNSWTFRITHFLPASVSFWKRDNPAPYKNSVFVSIGDKYLLIKFVPTVVYSGKTYNFYYKTMYKMIPEQNIFAEDKHRYVSLKDIPLTGSFLAWSYYLSDLARDALSKEKEREEYR